MTTKTISSSTGAALALAAAALFAGLTSTVAVAEESKVVACYGANGCKGHNDCKTANNSCKGQGSCKGKGFKNLTLAECNAIRAKSGK